MLKSITTPVRWGTLTSGVVLALSACFLGSGSPASIAQMPTRPAAPAPGPVTLAAPSVPRDTGGMRIYRLARRTHGLKILVSTEDRWLWLVQGGDTLMSVPVAVGMGQSFSYGGRNWYFDTPRGRRHVLSKKVDPVWTVPDWQYYEQAADKHLKLIAVKPGDRYPIPDAYIKYVVMRNGRVGWINRNGYFYAPDGQHFIEFAGMLFMPPAGSEQRKVHSALGPYALNMGDGYLLHGTNDFDVGSIGRAVSHGCVRLHNDDIVQLYHMVPVGTPVFIF